MSDFKPKYIEDLIKHLTKHKEQYDNLEDDSWKEVAANIGYIVLGSADHKMLLEALRLLYHRELDRVRLQKRIKAIFGNQKEKPE